MLLLKMKKWDALLFTIPNETQRDDACSLYFPHDLDVVRRMYAEEINRQERIAVIVICKRKYTTIAISIDTRQTRRPTD